ncbi:MAG: class I SAM-dependent methyltransferase, partial [Nitrospirota bacterium]|nr:class I SAM-dependent methyltransferase [Nitrospirota bacterium]
MRNRFIHPSPVDDEYLITRLRRDDLRVLVNRDLPKSSNAVVLDFGSRTSPYKDLFNGKIKKFLMADLVSSGQKHVDVDIRPDGTLNMPDGSVDVVLSLQVLEHVENIDTHLSEAKRVLKPGGLLWLTTHGMWAYHPTPDDYHRWTLAGLRRIIGQHFDITDTSALMGGPAFAVMIYINLLLLFTRKINSLQSKILNTLTRSQRWGKSGESPNKIKSPYWYLGSNLFL